KLFRSRGIQAAGCRVSACGAFLCERPSVSIAAVRAWMDAGACDWQRPDCHGIPCGNRDGNARFPSLRANASNRCSDIWLHAVALDGGNDLARRHRMARDVLSTRTIAPRGRLTTAVNLRTFRYRPVRGRTHLPNPDF